MMQNFALSETSARRKRALWFALLVVPDSRPLTRWKVMRGSVLDELSGERPIHPHAQRRLLSSVSGFQRWCVATGVALYALVRRRGLVLVIGAAAGGYFVWNFVSALLKVW